VPDIPVLELDLVRVKGRETPISIYTLCSVLGGDEARMPKLQREHMAFLKAFREGRWDEAETAIERCKALGFEALDFYYALFRSRIMAYRTSPPPADWGGVFTALEK
jgi:adenylate cyclase